MDIVDVDFRYVMKQVPAPEFGSNITKLGPVLQWRKKVIKRPSDGYSSAIKDWADWQDVRTEEE